MGISDPATALTLSAVAHTEATGVGADAVGLSVTAAVDPIGTSHAYAIKATTGDVLISSGKIIDNGAGSTIGATSSATQLTVNGVADANATSDAVSSSKYDLAVVGDISATGVLRTTGDINIGKNLYVSTESDAQGSLGGE